MTRHRRVPARVPRVMARLCGAVLLAACAGHGAAAGTPAARPAPLVLAVSSGPVSLPLYVAQAQGLFRDQGVDVALHACRSGRDCHAQLLAGEADLATAAELPIVLDPAPVPAAVIVATLCSSASQIRLVARRSAGIAEAPQLRGHRIGTVAGTSAQYFLDHWLVFNDLDPGGVTTVPLAPDALVPALAQRRIDAVAIWEPLASGAVAALGPDALVFDSPRVYTQHFNLVARRAALDARADEVARVLRALLAAEAFIAREPAQARALLVQRLAATPAQAADWLAEEDWRLRLDASLLATMRSERRWAIDAGLRPVGGAEPRDAIEAGPLRRVAPDAVGLDR